MTESATHSLLYFLLRMRINITRFHSFIEDTPATTHYIALLNAFVAISVLASITYLCTSASPILPTTILFVPSSVPPILIASFGASAVLLYAAPKSPFAQPKCAFFGQVFSAVVGVTVKQIFTYAGASQSLVWFEAGLAVSLAIFVMSITGTIHPPGGATALIGGSVVTSLGYWFVMMPVALGMLIMLTIAYFGNRAFGIKYPDYWLYPPKHTIVTAIVPEEMVV